MESHYVFCSLIGICVAWILMDLVLGMSDQIVPSFFMLLASLVAFRLILHCFPEDKCLQEIEMKKPGNNKSKLSTNAHDHSKTYWTCHGFVPLL